MTLCWVPSHVGVDMNEKADQAARSIITNGNVQPVLLPRSDFKCYIKRVVNLSWSHEWENTNNNKLSEIKPPIVPLVGSSNRRWDVILTHLRIGQTKFSHGYLMDRSNLSYCEDFLVQVTVKHIVLECPSFQEQRIEHFGGKAIDICDVLCDGSVGYGGDLYKYIDDSLFKQSIVSYCHSKILNLLISPLKLLLKTKF